MVNTITEITLLTESDKYCSATKIKELSDNMYEILRCVQLMYGGTSSYDTTLNDETSPVGLQDKFQAVEDEMYSINQRVGFVFDDMVQNEVNEPAQYIWEERPVDLREELNRWFRWSNGFKEICDGGDEDVQPMTDINNELTRDINNDIIYTEV